MLKTNVQKTVAAGLLLSLGILLPIVTSHSFALLPGIVIQLILIPAIVARVYKNTAKKLTAKNEAIKMIEDSSKTCVVVKNNRIISAESPKGIYHIIKLYENGLLKNSFVADTVIGKAVAMIFSLAKVKGCYGHTMSREALKWLNEHNIEASYSILTDYIINRKGDGMCPMEETVMNIDDEKTAIILLKAKVAKLQKNKQEQTKS